MSAESQHPVPKYLRHTKHFVDFLKFIVGLIVLFIGLGWAGHEYVGELQTEVEAQEAQTSNDTAHSELQNSIEHNGKAIDNIRVYNVRIELGQRNTNGQLDQLLILEQATTRAERREALREVEDIQDNIDRRERVIRNPRALKRVADRVEEDPLGGLNGL